MARGAATAGVLTAAPRTRGRGAVSAPSAPSPTQRALFNLHGTVLYDPTTSIPGLKIPRVPVARDEAYPIQVPGHINSVFARLMWSRMVQAGESRTQEEWCQVLFDDGFGTRKLNGKGPDKPIKPEKFRELAREWSSASLIPMNTQGHFELSRDRQQANAQADSLLGRGDGPRGLLRAVAGVEQGLQLSDWESRRPTGCRSWDQRAIKVLVENLALTRKTAAQLGALIGRELQTDAWSEAKVRDLIHDLRCDGYPIVSNSNGSTWADDPSEAEDWIARAQRRASWYRDRSQQMQRAAILWFPQDESERAKAAKVGRPKIAPATPSAEFKHHLATAAANKEKRDADDAADLKFDQEIAEAQMLKLNPAHERLIQTSYTRNLTPKEKKAETYFKQLRNLAKNGVLPPPGAKGFSWLTSKRRRRS